MTLIFLLFIIHAHFLSSLIHLLPQRFLPSHPSKNLEGVYKVNYFLPINKGNLKILQFPLLSFRQMESLLLLELSIILWDFGTIQLAKSWRHTLAIPIWSTAYHPPSPWQMGSILLVASRKMMFADTKLLILN